MNVCSSADASVECR